MLEDVLDGKATLETLSLIERTAKAIYDSADCAIGYEAGRMVLKGLEGFREDFIEHITNGHCSCHLEQPVPCVALCLTRMFTYECTGSNKWVIFTD